MSSWGCLSDINKMEMFWQVLASNTCGSCTLLLPMKELVRAWAVDTSPLFSLSTGRRASCPNSFLRSAIISGFSSLWKESCLFKHQNSPDTAETNVCPEKWTEKARKNKKHIETRFLNIWVAKKLFKWFHSLVFSQFGPESRLFHFSFLNFNPVKSFGE